MSETRTRISVFCRGETQTVSWYRGSTGYEIETAVRRVFDLPPSARIVLREATGEVIVISEHIPDGKTLFLSVEEALSPGKGSAAAAGGSPSRPAPSPKSLGDIVAARSVGRSSPAASGVFSSTSPARSPPPGSYSKTMTSSYSSGSPFRSSPSPSRGVADGTTDVGSSLAKQALKDVERLQKFTSRIEELRREKRDEFFELDVDSRWIWKRSVSNAEFMGAISSDLYFQAGSCGLLSSTRRTDAERVLSAALAAYMDNVRELGRQGIFDPIVLVDASFARNSLDAAYDAAAATARDLIKEKLAAADRYSRPM